MILYYSVLGSGLVEVNVLMPGQYGAASESGQDVR